jgi:hypothetical protein
LIANATTVRHTIATGATPGRRVNPLAEAPKDATIMLFIHHNTRGTTMKHLVLLIVAVTTGAYAYAAKPCDELKSEIAAKLEAKGAKDYTLEIVPADQASDGKLVGTCEGGKKKIVYAKK